MKEIIITSFNNDTQEQFVINKKYEDHDLYDHIQEMRTKHPNNLTTVFFKESHNIKTYHSLN